MGTATFTLPSRVRAVLEPPQRLTVSQWCDRHRYLSSRFGASPGRRRTALTPYLREPLDALIDPDTEIIQFSKSARVGGTEMANCMIGYIASERPMPVLYVQPEEEETKEELTGRIRTLFEDSPRLRRLIPPEKSWCTGHQVRLNSCDIYGGWASNPGTLKRRTIGVVYFGEIDNCEQQAGRLGNTLDFVRKRIITFGRRGKVIVEGTPTTEDASGWRMLLSSDYRRPYVPCPLCGQYQVLVFGQIKLRAEHADVRDAERIRLDHLAEYECEHCQGRLDYRRHHRWMIDRVVWVPKTQTPAEGLPLKRSGVVEQAKAVQDPGQTQWRPKLIGDPPRTRRRGYWINALYSPWWSWSDTFAEFIEAKDDPARYRVFVNSTLGEPWVDAVELTKVAVLEAKREAGGEPDVLPADAKLLVMGVDVQGESRPDQFYFALRAWCPFESSALVREGTATSFDQLYQLAFHTGFPLGARDGPLMRCHGMAIDSRYRQDEVYEFAGRPGVIPVKGADQLDVPFKAFPTRKGPDGRPMPGAPMYYLVNRMYFNRYLTRLMQTAAGQPGDWRLHRDASDAYLAHMTNKHLVRVKVGGKRKATRYEYVWQPISDGAPVDWWDAEAYALFAAHLFGAPLLRDDSYPIGMMAESRRSRVSSSRASDGSGPDPTQIPRGWVR